MRDSGKIHKLDVLLAKIVIEEKPVGQRPDLRRSKASRQLPLALSESDSQSTAPEVTPQKEEAFTLESLFREVEAIEASKTY